MSGALVEDYERLAKCPVCSGEFNGEKVNGNDMHFILQDGGKAPVYYYQCGSCGVWALSPRYTDKFLAEYYGGSYREVRPITSETLAWQKSRARTQMQLAGNYLTGKTMLEIGSSSGYLMAEFYRLGFTCTGVDPDPESGAAYPDLAQISEQAFDVIALSHTLEHMNHPHGVMETLVKNYGHPKTKIMVDVPNYPTCAAGGLYQFHHPLLFDKDSLTNLLESVGCNVVFDTIHGDGTDKPNNLLAVGEVQ